MSNSNDILTNAREVVNSSIVKYRWIDDLRKSIPHLETVSDDSLIEAYNDVVNLVLKECANCAETSYDFAFDDGYNAGTVEGYDEGYDEGQSDGYTKGYDAGKSDELN